jgi:hypothetical protein
MRLTPLQFVFILLAVAVGWAVYEYWWKYQDRNTWIRGMNKGIYESEAEDDTWNEPAKKEDNGWL